MIQSNKPERWTKNYYSIKQVTQVTGYLAVWADTADADEKPDTLIIRIEQLDFIGVAKVVTTIMCLDPGTDVSYPESEMEGTEVVAVALIDGMFEICDEAANFCGIVALGCSQTDILAVVRDWMAPEQQHLKLEVRHD